VKSAPFHPETGQHISSSRRCSKLRLIAESFEQNCHWIARRRAKLHQAIRHVAMLISFKAQSCSSCGSKHVCRQWRIEVAVFIDESHEDGLASLLWDNLCQIHIQIPSPGSSDTCASRKKARTRCDWARAMRFCHHDFRKNSQYEYCYRSTKSFVFQTSPR
jgi:hypothetical protein